MENNWVKKQTDCSIHNVFNSLLDRMEKDVEQANSHNLPCGAFIFKKATDSENRAYKAAVYRQDESGAPRVQIFIVLDKENYIRVSYVDFDEFTGEGTQYELFKVQHQWNPKDLTCTLIMRNQVVKEWEVSYEALHDFFFYEEHPVLKRDNVEPATITQQDCLS